MCCKKFWKGKISFILTACIGVLSVNLVNYFSHSSQNVNNSVPNVSLKKGKGIGTSGGCYGKTVFDVSTYNQQSPVFDATKDGFQIISKPCPRYTNLARQNEVAGIMRVRVVFLSTGEIGSVTPINTLPYGLTEQVINAAKQIKFQPAVKDGKLVTVTKIIEYQFNIY